MEIEELKKRIEKKEKDIEKINRRIEKWSKGLRQSDIDICKPFGTCTYGSPKRGTYWGDFHGTPEYQKARNDYKIYVEKEKGNIPQSDDYNKGPNIEELMRAYIELGDANITLQKYKNALKIENDRESEDKIEILIEFLNNWKIRVNNYIHEDAKRLKELYAINSELCQKHNSGWYRQHPEVDSELERDTLYYEPLKSINPLTKECYDRDSSTLIKEDLLKKELDEEAKRKYYKLVEQITSVVGDITDVSNLSIGGKGDLNGIVTGTLGKAKVQTFGAGGYAIQCFHYRTRVDKI